MSQLERFRTEVEEYLDRTKMLPTQFGRDAVRDPNFVRDLRQGRAPGLSTVDRVLSFMREPRASATPTSQEPASA